MDPLEQLAARVLDHIDREYPYKTGLIWTDASEVISPRTSSPVFGGSFDWHSSVHSHWTLVRLMKMGVGGIEAVLEQRFTADAFAAERDAIDRPHRRGFEMPYGIAWLLLLASEIERPDWSAAIEPLVELALDRFVGWLEALVVPIRDGQHGNSALAMTLALEAAGALGFDALASVIRRRAADFYAGDAAAPLAYEPSAYDFVSPTLAEAELLAAVWPADQFSSWWDGFAIGAASAFTPVETTDRADGKLAHWDGLNLSRAWMLSSIAAVLDDDELADLADRHRSAGMSGLEAASYAGTHWLPTFALRAMLVGARGQVVDAR